MWLKKIYGKDQGKAIRQSWTEKDASDPENTVFFKLGSRTSSTAIDRLIAIIFSRRFARADNDDMGESANFSYDEISLPHGNASQDVLSMALVALQDCANTLREYRLSPNDKDIKLIERLEKQSNQYYMLIPHSRLWYLKAPVLANEKVVLREIEILQSFYGKEIGEQIKAGLDESAPRYDAVKPYLTSLHLKSLEYWDHKSQEYLELYAYAHGTWEMVNPRFHLAVKDVFRVECEAETDCFPTYARARSDYEASSKTDNQRLLWYGTSASNYPQIISHGLGSTRDLDAKPVPSLSFSDTISRAVQRTRWRNPGDTVLLLLCQVDLSDFRGDAVGRSSTQSQEPTTATSPAPTTSPIWAWKDAGEAMKRRELAGVQMPDWWATFYMAGVFDNLDPTISVAEIAELSKERHEQLRARFSNLDEYEYIVPMTRKDKVKIRYGVICRVVKRGLEITGPLKGEQDTQELSVDSERYEQDSSAPPNEVDGENAHVGMMIDNGYLLGEHGGAAMLEGESDEEEFVDDDGYLIDEGED